MDDEEFKALAAALAILLLGALCGALIASRIIGDSMNNEIYSSCIEHLSHSDIKENPVVFCKSIVGGK